MKPSILRIILLVALGAVATACAGTDSSTTTSSTASTQDSVPATSSTVGTVGSDSTVATTTSTPLTTTTIQTTTSLSTTTSSTVAVTTTAPAPTTTASPTTTKALTVITVTMGSKDGAFFYSPGGVSVPVGGRVVWVNKDTEDHDVQSGVPATCDGLFCSGAIAPGMSYSFTFTTPGMYNYFCLLHPGLMLGTINVTDE